MKLYEVSDIGKRIADLEMSDPVFARKVSWLRRGRCRGEISEKKYCSRLNHYVCQAEQMAGVR